MIIGSIIEDIRLIKVILYNLGRVGDYTEKELRETTVSMDEMASIEELFIPFSKIKSLEGVQHFPNLKALCARGNSIENLSPLEGLTNLKELDLHNNLITDISPLSGLTNLEVLHLGFNKINFASPLLQLGKLKQVSVEYNRIEDFQALAESQREIFRF